MKQVIFLLLLSFVFNNEIINKNFVDKLKKTVTYKVYEPEENPFRDWTDEEIKAMFGTMKRFPDLESQSKREIKFPKDIPSYDFRAAYPECLTDIRNQENCGGSWAFAGAMTLQYRICQEASMDGRRNNIVLSPQDLLSCCSENMGCDGGDVDVTWDYLQKTGVVEESCFPFSSQRGNVEPCITQCKDGSAMNKWTTKEKKKYTSLQEIIHMLPTEGPMQTQFDVYSDFMTYFEGIYYHSYGTLLGTHSVTILGFGHDGVEDKDYWTCQNSWGLDWGEIGSFRIQLGECGIEDYIYAANPVKY